MDMDDDHDAFHREYNYDVNSKVMLSAIISLSFVIILVTILHIYARCVLRRQAQRQAALSRLSFIIISSATSFHTAGGEPPKTGLDPEVIATLPVFIFIKKTNNEIECPVCLSMLEDGETARTLPNCKHTFHSYCIDKWFDTNSTCPVCRTEAQPQPRLLVAEPREGVVVGELAKAAAAGPSSSSRSLSSFRRIILSRERSSSSTRMHIQSCGIMQEEYGMPDLERH